MTILRLQILFHMLLNCKGEREGEKGEGNEEGGGGREGEVRCWLGHLTDL